MRNKKASQAADQVGAEGRHAHSRGPGNDNGRSLHAPSSSSPTPLSGTIPHLRYIAFCVTFLVILFALIIGATAFQVIRVEDTERVAQIVRDVFPLCILVIALVGLLLIALPVHMTPEAIKLLSRMVPLLIAFSLCFFVSYGIALLKVIVGIFK